MTPSGRDQGHLRPSARTACEEGPPPAGGRCHHPPASSKPHRSSNEPLVPLDEASPRRHAPFTLAPVGEDQTVPCVPSPPPHVRS